MRRLGDLFEELPVKISGSKSVLIRGFSADSRSLRPGDLFVAFSGQHVDAKRFIPEATARGAAAVISSGNIPHALRVPYIQAEDLYATLAVVARRFYRSPSSALRLIGVTGTNGKTSTTYLLETIFNAAGIRCGVLGTIDSHFNGMSEPSLYTTPPAFELQRILAWMQMKGAQACAMEVSSHALALERLQGIEMDTGIFTNLTQDHLDFHRSMENYRESKAKLFGFIGLNLEKKFPRGIVVNMDDPAHERMIQNAHVPVLKFGMAAASIKADLFASEVKCDLRGVEFALRTPYGETRINLPYIGKHNVSNALGAIGAALLQKIPLDVITKALQGAPGVPGRMQRIEGGQSFVVLVDYAHTPDALSHALSALKASKPERIITVFGCGGERDRAKRPLMGEIAAHVSDLIFVTSDNPRSEAPRNILLDIEVGIKRVRKDGYRLVEDREEAIAAALAEARASDVVIIAGKGHENYQILRNERRPFSDEQVALRLIRHVCQP